MILSAVFSKPAKDAGQKLNGEYIKVRILRLANPASPNAVFAAEFFTKTQVFQKKMSEAEAETFYKTHAGTTFKNTVCTTDTKEITTLANRHGQIKTLEKQKNTSVAFTKSALQNRSKNYILKEGVPVPFLVHLGVMNAQGKIISSKYDKFRQINRFLEFLDDILGDVIKLCTNKTGFTKERPLNILDFGSGKSYLTFAVHHYLTQIKKIPVHITGVDLKKEVIENCQAFAKKCGYSDIEFICGDVALFNKAKADIMITLHACDTATDYALNYAIKNQTSAILSVPCCQHELNAQLEKDSDAGAASIFMHHGILKERFAALATDAIRAELLEQNGYCVQLLEFIDDEGTPKNLLIRAIKKSSAAPLKKIQLSQKRTADLISLLNVNQTLKTLTEGI